jgi:hypothetical protein
MPVMSHDLAEKMSESLWHSASLVVEILLISHCFFPFRFNLGVHLDACTPVLPSECSVSSISCHCLLTVAFAFTQDIQEIPLLFVSVLRKIFKRYQLKGIYRSVGFLIISCC